MLERGIYLLGFQSHRHLQDDMATSNFTGETIDPMLMSISEYSHVLVEPPMHHWSAGRPSHMKAVRG